MIINNISKPLIYLLNISLSFAYIEAQGRHQKLFEKYPLIVERLLFFKQDNFKVFFGGPIDRTDKGVKWMMPVTFEDAFHKTRAVYEISFINCDLNSARDAEILYVEVADINIKLKNVFSQDDRVFSSLLNGEYKNDKYIVIRFSDVANVYYPDIFILSEYGEKKLSDRDDIVSFLHKQFKTSNVYKNYYFGGITDEIQFQDKTSITYKPISVGINFDRKIYPFSVKKIIKKNDTWRVYYIISTTADSDLKKSISDIANITHLRLDSGCTSGQIYGDEACDCLDQLHGFLKQFAQDPSHNGVIIHIPTHDGRGFGTAPKAETEIYKRGGRGRIHSTVSLDTVAAAKLLYGVDDYDLRSFDGAGAILKNMGINKVILYTDNVEKVNILKNCGIETIRQKTNTNKTSCLKHINAKKNCPFYFSE